MSIFKIAWRSIQQRGVASVLTMFSMALGVMLVVIVLSIHGLIRASFQSNSSVGYNLVIGSRGGSMQLALNSVYYLSQPIETIPYEYYLAFRSLQQRQREIEDSMAYRAHTAQWNAVEIQSVAAPLPGLGPAEWMTQLAMQETLRESERGQMGMREPGMYYNYVELAVPICLGDYFGDYRVVATTADFAEQIEVDVEKKQTLEFAQGRNFEEFNDQHGFFECYVGSVVARRMNVQLGDKINPTHGAPDGHTHQNGFTVVGILSPSNTPNDRAVFINIEGFYLMDDHAKPISELSQMNRGDEPDGEDEGNGDEWNDDGWIEGGLAGDPVASDGGGAEPDRPADPDDGPAYSQIILQERLPLEQREVTAVLVRTSGYDEADIAAAAEEDRAFMEEMGSVVMAMHLDNAIDEGVLESTLNWTRFRPDQAQKSAQAIAPVGEIQKLLEVFVKPVQLILLVLTVMICCVAGISILVSIYNSMNERRSEIAVMRALGARRETVMRVILVESMLLSLAGGLAGWVAAHGLNAAISPYVEAHTGVTIGFFDFAPPIEILGLLGINWPKISPEWALIPGLIGLSIVVGLYPAFAAYRADVAKSLG